MSGNELFESQGVRVAVVGCGHGKLDTMYASVGASCEDRDWESVDVLIICGDFQAARNRDDLTVMSVPAKYRAMEDFHEYYIGRKFAPWLTIFVGGNHEAAAHMWELYYGGWVAPNIYYMGAANVLRFGPLRIAALSGIWKGFDYRKSHHERLPFTTADVKSFYHVREFDVRRLLQLRSQVDIGLSHDWPRAVERHGDEQHLWRMKPAFERESREGSLGNPAAAYVMDRLRPPYWFSGHMHCKFPAVKTYDAPSGAQSGITGDAEAGESGPAVTGAATVAPVTPAAATGNSQVENPDEIELDMNDDGDDKDEGPPNVPREKESGPVASKSQESSTDVPEELRAQLPASFARPLPQEQRQHQQRQPNTTPGQPVPPGITNTVTRFLALDKCSARRHFLQVCEIHPYNPADHAVYPPAEIPPYNPADRALDPPTTFEPRYHLHYDPEWLAITRVFSRLLTIGTEDPPPPDQGEAYYAPLIDAERAWVDEHIVAAGRLKVPLNFTITAPTYVPPALLEPISTGRQPDEHTNPQTAAFCELLGIENLWAASEEERQARRAAGPPKGVDPARNIGGGGRGGFGGFGGGGNRDGGGSSRGGRGARSWGGRGRGMQI